MTGSCTQEFSEEDRGPRLISRRPGSVPQINNCSTVQPPLDLIIRIILSQWGYPAGSKGPLYIFLGLQAGLFWVVGLILPVAGCLSSHFGLDFIVAPPGLG